MSTSNHELQRQTSPTADGYRAVRRPRQARTDWARLLARAIFLLSLVISTLTACRQTPSPTTPVASEGAIAIRLTDGLVWVQHENSGDWVREEDSFALSFGHRLRTEDMDAELELADGSILRLMQSSTVEIVRSSPSDERPTFRLLRGALEVVAQSSSFQVDTTRTISVSFTMRRLDMTVVPLEPGTMFRLWLEAESSSLSVEAGRVEVTSEDQRATLSAGEQAAIDESEQLQITALPTATPTTAATPTLPPGVTPTDTLTPTPQFTPTPSVTPTPLFTPTPTALPILYPAPLLMHINDGAVVHLGTEFTLIWQPIENLDSGDWYEVQVWPDSTEPQGVHWTRDNLWEVDKDEYPLGSYHWRVIVVRREGEISLGEVSPPSETRAFHVEPVPEPPTKPPSTKPTATKPPAPTNTPKPPTPPPTLPP
ncbi:MAG: FecR domain-containing protein [Chloroflexota bacterium]|nr:FecR domain-containing protein [Chloroflexota bacterium]